MSKKDFIALADAVRAHNAVSENQFTDEQLDTMACFCFRQNSAFKRERWLSCIAGECGPNGGAR